MLYVQSLWSKPMFDKQLALKKIGWYNKRIFYYGTVLSALLLDRSNSGNTVLVTDQQGKKLLVDILELPYSNVFVELDAINKYDIGLWALGKIYTYALMKEPFIHFDNDFFMCAKLPDTIEKSELCAWSPEMNKHFVKEVYIPALHLFVKEYKKMHPLFDSFIKKQTIHAYNAGIIGGNYLPIFQEMKEIVFYLVDNNKSSLDKNNQFNIILEQYLYGCLAQHHNKEISCLETSFSRPHLSPRQNVHLLGHIKNEISVCKEVEEVLKEEFPSHYQKVNYLLQRNII